MRRAFQVAAAAGLLAACRLFVDTDGLSGAPADAGAGDSSTVDGATPPGPPPPPPTDSGTDGTTPDADAGPSPYCATVDAGGVFFCDSFDQGDTSFSAWSLAELSNGGQIALATTSPKSAPGFLRASYSGGSAGMEATAMLSRLFPAARTHVTWSADVRVQSNPSVETIELLEIYSTITNYYWAAYLALDATGAISIVEEYPLDAGGGASQQTDINSAVLGINQWHRVNLSFDFSAKTFVARIDGQQVASGPLINPPPNPTLKVSAGISWCAKPETAVVDMDNVVASD